MYVRDIQNKGKEGGQTNESLNTRAAHAADAVHDAEAVDWKEAGGHPEGRAEKGKGERVCGASPFVGPRSRPQSPCPPFPAHSPILLAEVAQCYYGPPAPGANSVALQKQSIQTSILYVVYREADW